MKITIVLPAVVRARIAAGAAGTGTGGMEGSR